MKQFYLVQLNKFLKFDETGDKTMTFFVSSSICTENWMANPNGRHLQTRKIVFKLYLGREFTPESGIINRVPLPYRFISC